MEDDESMSVKKNEQSFSDIAFEVEEKHRKRELKRHHSEGDVVDPQKGSEVDETRVRDIQKESVKERAKPHRNSGSEGNSRDDLRVQSCEN